MGDGRPVVPNIVWLDLVKSKNPQVFFIIKSLIMLYSCDVNDLM